MVRAVAGLACLIATAGAGEAEQATPSAHPSLAPSVHASTQILRYSDTTQIFRYSDSTQSTTPCPGVDEAGYEGILQLSRQYAKANKTSPRGLVIAPGEGTTATRSLRRLLSLGFGMRTLHFGRGALGLHAALARAGPLRYHTLDWVQLMEAYDAVLDTPIASVFPFLLAAFPNALVLHTVRPARDWAARRRHHHQEWAFAPFSSYFSASVFAEQASAYSAANMSDQNGTDHLLPILFSAHNLFVRCSVPKHRYMQVNAFAGDICAPGFLPKLQRFFSQPLGPRQWCTFKPNVSKNFFMQKIGCAHGNARNTSTNASL